MLNLIIFESNIPQELTLDPDSRPVKLPGASGWLYSSSDGRLLHLGPSVADSLRLLGLKPGESFRICLHERVPELPFWSVWLSPETEKARAIDELQAEPLETKLAASLAFFPGPVAETSDVRSLRPTGTEGPRPKPAIAAVASGKRKAAGAIPYNVAFRELVTLVASELKAAGEQWSDQARQDAVSTLFIAAQKAGFLTVWERDAA